MVREEGESIVNVVQVPVMTFNQVMEIEFDSPPRFRQFGCRRVRL